MSSASLTAVTVLENPRKDARGKTVTFDAQIYLGAYKPLTVEFRYFNANDISFDEVGTYVVHGTIARWIENPDPSGASQSSDSIQAAATMKTDGDGSADKAKEDGIDELGYDFVGDIIWLIPVNANPRHLAWVHSSGTVNKSDDKSSFDLDPTQYTSALRGAPASMMPLHCIIPDSARYKNKKPLPRVGTMVSFEGYLCSRMANPDTGRTERYHIDIEHVSFMGRATVPGPQATPKAASTPAKRKFTFSFNDVDVESPLSGAGKRGKAAAIEKK
ncbi:hypothetical protein HWV62_34199 [Athelia sp. TMB]|nr:hypothetical protein HWV62_34199 [Athelia sp. TMB]